MGFRYLGGINESSEDGLQGGFAKLICMGRGETGLRMIKENR